MTLSILIPTFNYDARALVSSMLYLLSAEGIEGEVVVGDDASTADMVWLDDIAVSPRVRVLRSSYNLGRARNRNRLAEAAHGEWLLIVDCDACVEDDFSLRAYLEAGQQAPVVCGGLRHPEENPTPEATLRYRYEREADKRRKAAIRQLHPYAHFSTFNLLIRREVFLSIRLDESCIDYGYEDTLFGADLQRRGIAIRHIDNPLVHEGLEPNDVYLSKTETALRTLHRLGARMEGHSSILAIAQFLKRWHVSGVVVVFYRLLRESLRRNLLGNRPNLMFFKFYKLGYFLSIKD